MAPSKQDNYSLQEPKSRLYPGMTGPQMAADTPYQGAEPKDPNGATADNYDGLQVLETGIEVVPPSALPEALPPPHHQAHYAEYKPWPQYSPEQSQPLHPQPGAYAYPVQVTPGSSTTSPPHSGAIAADYQYHGGHNPFSPPGKTTANGRVCGLRKMVFWSVLAITIFVIVAAVAIGVGVGLGTRSDAPAASKTTGSLTTDALPAATATATAGSKVDIICPSANRTEYSLATSSSDQKFLVLCGRDYNGCCGAVDMYSINTTTFESCLEECGGQEGCVAVGWGNYYGVNTCWLKSAIGEPNWSESWYAAVAE